MTLEEFKSLRPGQITYEKGIYGSDGQPRRWKINGKMQGSLRTGSARWPLQHGLYTHGYLKLDTISVLELTEEKAKEYDPTA